MNSDGLGSEIRKVNNKDLRGENMKKDILQAWWGIESTKHNKEKYKLSYFRLRTSVQQETALRKGNGEPQPGEVLQQI